MGQPSILPLLFFSMPLCLALLLLFVAHCGLAGTQTGVDGGKQYKLLALYQALQIGKSIKTRPCRAQGSSDQH